MSPPCHFETRQASLSVYVSGFQSYGISQFYSIFMLFHNMAVHLCVFAVTCHSFFAMVNYVYADAEQPHSIIQPSQQRSYSLPTLKYATAAKKILLLFK
jgi:hypothetical protein